MGHTHFGNGCCEYKGTYKNNMFDSTLSSSSSSTSSKRGGGSISFARSSSSVGDIGSSSNNNSTSTSGEVCVFTCVDGRQYKGGFKDGKKHGVVSMYVYMHIFI